MKIGDRVFVHGYIDEMRKDTVIIRNNGGYFGTVPSEVIVGELPSVEPEIIRCEDCAHYDGRPCGLVNWYNGKKDFCSRRVERRGDSK